MKLPRLLIVLIMLLAFMSVNCIKLSAQTETKLVASDGAAGDNFGYRCAISGEFVIVGSPYNDNEKGIDAGAAYIFHRKGDEWSETQKLTGSNTADSNLFGYAVDIDGDYAIVSACWSDQDGEKSGSAYIYKYNGSKWKEEAFLTANDAFKADVFGIAAAICGDYVIVGSLFDDDCGTTTGSAYIFKKMGTDWIEQDKLLPGDCAANDRFGVEVEIQGDYALVTSQYDDNEMGHDAGAVYIFKRDGNNWQELDKLIPADSAGNVGYGLGSIYADQIVVGAYADDKILKNAGLAYIYNRYGDQWVEVDRLRPDDLKEGDQFGSFCSFYKERIAISANSADDVAPDAGACYVYRWNKSEWYQEMKITPSDGDTLDKFGTQMDLDEEYLLIAARYNDELGENAGAVYVYRLEPIITRINDNELLTSGLFLIYPNPVRDQAILEYQLAKRERISIELYDMQGIRVQSFLTQKMRQSGIHEEIIHIDESIPVGNYFLVISNSTEKQTIRITIQ